MNIKEVFRKNKDDLKGIFLRSYPDFIFKKRTVLETGEIPVFVFHSVIKEKFEEQLKYLAENNYKTVKADNLLDILTGDKKGFEKTVVLTFDDGLGSLWTIAYPLLKKYGFVGISFLIPSIINDNDEVFPNLEDFWQGKTSMDTISQRESISPFCKWNEIKTMHNSGIIDFQSHSNYHSSVFVSNKLVNFVNPAFKPSLLNSSLNPLVIINGKEILGNDIDWGFPIYKWDANLNTKTRYIENEMVSKSCIEFVKHNGGKNFFTKYDWKKQLENHWRESISKFEKFKNFQFPGERENDIKAELIESKQTIENKLNKDVKHLCYPWYKGNKNSIKISNEVGYKANYWGMIGGRAINIVGDDPFYIRRLNEQYVFSLPGKGRKSLFKLLSNKMIYN